MRGNTKYKSLEAGTCLEYSEKARNCLQLARGGGGEGALGGGTREAAGGWAADHTAPSGDLGISLS